MTDPDREHCHDCGIAVLSRSGNRCEWYMVHDRIWAEATGGEPTIKYLCIGDLEKRLGRKLRRADFTPAKVNNLGSRNGRYAWSWRTHRLLDRLTRR